MPFPPFDASPLSEEELDELDAFLMEDRGDDDGMMLDAMDGYLHAVAIGPTTLTPSQWLPGIWGRADAQGMMPSGASLAQVSRVLGVLRCTPGHGAGARRLAVFAAQGESAAPVPALQARQPLSLGTRWRPLPGIGRGCPGWDTLALDRVARRRRSPCRMTTGGADYGLRTPLSSGR